MVKRAVDIVAAVCGIVLLSPVMLVIAFWIRSTSPGGALFAQMRIGRFERPFRCYKFRTMTAGAPVASTHEVPSAWVTPVGRFLRARKLDELPQLWSVLKGEMSLVGPRPCLPSQHDLIAARRARGVFNIRPGITGLAQLQNIDMSKPERLAEADAVYVATRSFWLDATLLLRTVFQQAGAGDRVGP
jgi:O-antigen biosynthesis protein WbqP